MATRIVCRPSRGEARASGAAWASFVLSLACLLTLVVFAWPGAASATTLENLSVEQMSRRSTDVVQGTVVATSVDNSVWGVRTAVRLRVGSTLKGPAGHYVTVYVPGGVLPDGTRVVVDGMASFRVGDTCFVFADQRSWVVGGFQGKLGVAGGRVLATGESIAAFGRRVKAALGATEPPRRNAARSGGLAVTPVRTLASRGAGSPTITSITPGEASAGTHSYVTINGAGFGVSGGRVEFSYGRKGVMRIATTDIASWSDTAISCEVPTGIIDNYSASAGSGPVVVTTAGSVESNGFAFRTTFGYGGAKWASPGLTYLVNTSGIDPDLRENLVDAGAGVWNASGSSFVFTDGGTTSAGFANDGFNVISWANGLPSGVIAEATSYISGATVVQCDIQFSNAFSWGDGAPGSGTMDVQSISMHETGHWLRLLDQYMPNDAGKIMYGYGSAGTQKRTLSAGDIAGINWIYPGAGPVPGSLTGTVSDGGGPVAGVSVAVGALAPATTAANGAYTVSGILPGTYSVTYAKSGYVSQTLSGVVISAGGTTTRDVTLQAQATPSPSPSPTTTPTTTPTPTPTPTPVGDDDVPGVVIPGSPFIGAASAATDRDDVFAVALRVGQTLKASVTGSATSDIRLYLYAPGAATVKDPKTPRLAVSSSGNYPRTISFTAATAGIHYLDVSAVSGVGGYTVTYSVRSAPDDRVGPVCAAKTVSVARGGTCTVSYKVRDAHSARVTRRVAITTKSGAVMKRWTWGYGANKNGWWTVKFTCRLAKGVYRIVVTGEDLAGNSASVVGRGTLKVK